MGAEIDVKDHYGETPLRLATRRGYVEVAKLLLEKGAKSKAKNTISAPTSIHDGEPSHSVTATAGHSKQQRSRDLVYMPMRKPRTSIERLRAPTS